MEKNALISYTEDWRILNSGIFRTRARHEPRVMIQISMGSKGPKRQAKAVWIKREMKPAM
jgi:hypothetical protein